MTEEMQKRIEEAAYSYDTPRHFNCYGCCQSDSDYEKAFKAGAKFILEMPELREAVEALKFYRQYSDCVEDCRSRSDSWVLKCTCGFVAKEKEHRQALSKIKALGIVKEGE